MEDAILNDCLDFGGHYIESLKTVQAQLKIYRQAVLEHAFEGKLTAQWREDNKDKLESAVELLERIKQERETYYQQQLKDWKEGVNSVKPKKPDHISDLTDKEISLLITLPDGWPYIRLGAIINKPKYGTSKKCDYELNGLGVLRIPNIVSDLIDDTDLKYAEFDNDEIATYKLEQGDILTIRSNGSISIVGKCAIIVNQRAKLTRVLGKTALKSFHPRLFKIRYFIGEPWSVNNGYNCRSQKAASCQRGEHQFNCQIP
jgi:type I restriction enzyme S subunit